MTTTGGAAVVVVVVVVGPATVHCAFDQILTFNSLHSTQKIRSTPILVFDLENVVTRVLNICYCMVLLGSARLRGVLKTWDSF